MSKKRLQLFIIYSLGLCVIIAMFSAVIYDKVRASEALIIHNDLKRKSEFLMTKMNNNALNLLQFNQIANEESIWYVLWDGANVIETNCNGLSWGPPQATEQQELEQMWGGNQGSCRANVFSVSRTVFLNGHPVTLQVVELSNEVDTEISELKSVLILGTMIVSILGIFLGIVLTYIGMKPIVASWKRQRTFVADASHELRTPLSIIMLKSEHLVTNSQDLVDDHLEEIVVIQQECRRMYKMVTDLLFLAKSDSGVLDLELTDFSVTKLTDELKLVYDEFFEIEEKQLLLDIEYSGNVNGDYEKIKQVCMIIIDNALRFTKAHDYVKISTKVRGPRVYFDIMNNGVPIKHEDLSRIFHRFYKSDTSRNKTHENEGHGLGLNIAQEILHAHQSRIKAYVKDGEITVFNFYLNKAKDKN